MKATRLLVTVLGLIVIAGIGYGLFRLFTFAPDFQMPEAPPPTVIVARPVIQAVDESYDFTGTTVAVEQVDIRARVQGFLEKIHFVEGSRVKCGDPLFEIERTSYQAMRDQAEAQLRSRQAEVVRTRLDLERVEQAIKTNAVSQQEVTTRRAQRDQAEAQVVAAEAALKQADLDLGYTRIVAPIDGRISRRYVDAGNLVGAGQQTLLATVVRLQPVYVHFYVSEGFLIEKLGAGSFDGRSTRPFFVARENEPDFSHRGVLNYMDNRVDEGTGTILLRGELPNADEAFLPGMFFRVRVPVGTQADAICVYDRALGTDIGGKFLLLVDEDGVVHRRPVETGRPVGQMRVITSGLSPDEKYILKGMQFVFPGAKVNAVLEGQIPPVPADSNVPHTGPAQE